MKSIGTPLPLRSFFWSGETLRSRDVSAVVLSGTVAVPARPARLVADCEREIDGKVDLAPGEVEALALARAWLCLQPTPDGACGRCSSCHAADVRTHPDLLVLIFFQLSN